MFSFIKRVISYINREKTREGRIQKWMPYGRILRELELLKIMKDLKYQMIDELYSENKDVRVDDVHLTEGLTEYKKRFKIEVKKSDGLKMLKTDEPIKTVFGFIEYWVNTDPLILKPYMDDVKIEPEEIRAIVNKERYLKDKNQVYSLPLVSGMIDIAIFDTIKPMLMDFYLKINYGDSFQYKKKPHYSQDNLTSDEIIEGKKYKDYEVEKR